MLNPLMAIVAFEVEMLIEYIVLSYISPRRKSSVACLTIGGIFFLGAAALNLVFSNNIAINVAVTALVSFSFAIICFQLRIPETLFYTLIFCVLSSTLEGVVVFVVSAFLQGQPKDYNTSPILTILYIFASKTILLLLLCILVNSRHLHNRRLRFPFYIILCPLATLFSFVDLAYVCTKSSIGVTEQYVTAAIGLCLHLSTIIFVLLYQHKTEKETELWHVRRELSKAHLEKTYYELLKQQNENLMLYAHDVKNHLAVIQSLNTKPEINKYITELTDLLTDYSQTCHSGNMFLDVIIDRYVTECKQLNICFDYDVKISNLKELSELDLVAVLGNLMDNAVTAAGQTSERHIHLETTRRNSYAVIVLRNSCETTPRQERGHLITSKKETLQHGFGLKSVAETLKKYQGDIYWEYDESKHVFSTTVMLWSPIPKENIDNK